MTQLAILFLDGNFALWTPIWRWVECLFIAFHCTPSVLKWLFFPFLLEQILPSVQHDDLAIRNQAILALGLSCTLDLETSKRYLPLFYTVSFTDGYCVWRFSFKLWTLPFCSSHLGSENGSPNGACYCNWVYYRHPCGVWCASIPWDRGKVWGGWFGLEWVSHLTCPYS